MLLVSDRDESFLGGDDFNGQTIDTGGAPTVFNSYPMSTYDLHSNLPNNDYGGGVIINRRAKISASSIRYKPERLQHSSVISSVALGPPAPAYNFSVNKSLLNERELGIV